MAAGWFLYLIECLDGSLYTGIAVDVHKRYAAHAAGKGSRYMRAHPPARLLAMIAYPDRATASVAEYRVKQLSPAAKRTLAESHPAWAPAAERKPDGTSATPPSGSFPGICFPQASSGSNDEPE